MEESRKPLVSTLVSNTTSKSVCDTSTTSTVTPKRPASEEVNKENQVGQNDADNTPRLSEESSNTNIDDTVWPLLPTNPVPTRSTTQTTLPSTESEVTSPISNIDHSHDISDLREHIFGTAQSPIVLDSPASCLFLNSSPLASKRTSTVISPLVDTTNTTATASSSSSSMSISDIMERNLASFSSESYKTAIDTSENNIVNTEDDSSTLAVAGTSYNSSSHHQEVDTSTSDTTSVEHSNSLNDINKSDMSATTTSNGDTSTELNNDNQCTMMSPTSTTENTGPIAIKTNSTAGYQILTPVKPSSSTSSTKDTDTAESLCKDDNDVNAVEVTATPVAVRAMAQETPPPRNLDDQVLTSISEFDPLADTKEMTSPTKSTKEVTPKPSNTATVKKDQSDWMLQFETPMPQRIKLQEQLTARRTRLNRTTPKLSVLDLSFEFATPRSAPTYSERDVEMIRAKAEAEAEEQIAKVRHELEQYQNALSKETKTKQQMETIMNEFETTMNRMINDAKKERANYSTNMAIITEERDLLQDHVTKVEQAFEELKKRYEMRKSENEKMQKEQENLRKMIETLKSDNLIYKERFDKLEEHAEAQLEHANVTLKEMRAEYKKKVDSLQATNLKAEVQVKQLESLVATKTKENEDLMKLCEDIISRVEGGIA
ncbi:transforming acidic coiled-coil-containing protein-domain containing protein [Syncephalis plumigaleata]|nr:transforming acidic coiled-coil-containing protein-domain containing protein [Syncephalis plumigaleata]